jgi:protein ImuA
MTADTLLGPGRKARTELALLPGIALARGRVHEATGPARRSFAAFLAGRVSGPVVWIAPSWQAERLHPEGLRPFVDPGRFLFVHPARAQDLLWTLEEVLRSGLVPLAVAELPEPPGLTPVRRLHLAAESAGTAPLGLLLTPGEGGAAGIETRWYIAPRHGAQSSAWRLERRRARALPPRAWTLRPDRDGLRAES